MTIVSTQGVKSTGNCGEAVGRYRGKDYKENVGESWNVLWVHVSMHNNGNRYQEEKEKSQEGINRGEKGRVG